MSLFVSNIFLRQRTVTSFLCKLFYFFKVHSFFNSWLSKFYLLQHQVCRLHLTGGLALGWQDVVLLQQRFFNLAFVRGWTSCSQLFFVTFIFSNFIRLRFRGWTLKMSSPTPSPIVSCNTKNSTFHQNH